MDDEQFPDFKICKIYPHLIKTSPLDGLKDKYVDVAVRMINRQNRHPKEFLFDGLESVQGKIKDLMWYDRDEYELIDWEDRLIDWDDSFERQFGRKL